MKKIAYLILLMILSSSCEGLLDEEVYSTLTPANFFQNENDIEVAVNGVYDAIQGPEVVHRNNQAEIQTWSMNNMMAGQMNNKWSVIWETLQYNSVGSMELWQLWAECFADVAKANGVLKAIEETDVIDQELKDRYSAELRYIRAFRYFDQVRSFGHFPLVTNVPENLSDAIVPDSTETEDVYESEFLKQLDREDIYDFIVEELEWCEDHLPDQYTESTDIGRVTSGAASGMLARVYLFRAGKRYDYDNGGLLEGDPSYYSLCADKCEELMDGRYALVENYTDLFENSNEYNEEVLFSIGYISSAESGQLYEGTSWAPENGIKGADIFPKCYNMNHVSNEFFADWKLANDSTEDLRYSTTFQTMYIDKEGDTVHMYTGNFVGPLCPKIISNFTHPLDPVLDSRDYGDNWIIQRYADVLLMHSEALNEAGTTPDANTIEGINLVRERAGKALIELPISKEELREEIWNERKWELCFEGCHYWDCLRTGRYLDEITRYMNFHRKVEPDLKYNIQPIPHKALEANRSLTQNFGWD